MKKIDRLSVATFLLMVALPTIGLGMLALPSGSHASGACGTITSPDGCTYFGLPQPAEPERRAAGTAAAAMRIGGTVCRFGEGEDGEEALVAGHEMSCIRAGGRPDAASLVAGDLLAPEIATAGRPAGAAPIIGYLPVTWYMPVLGASAGPPRTGAGATGGAAMAAMACSFGDVVLSAARVADCERAGGMVVPPTRGN